MVQNTFMTCRLFENVDAKNADLYISEVNKT